MSGSQETGPQIKISVQQIVVIDSMPVGKRHNRTRQGEKWNYDTVTPKGSVNPTGLWELVWPSVVCGSMTLTQRSWAFMLLHWMITGRGYDFG